ncbi:MAG: hypothetical protein ACFE94_10985 [Candidatus Hodarchaeota archaeon]
MVWGGSLNKEGSDYLRKIRKADEVIEFLEKLKHNLNPDENVYITKVIDIIMNFISKLSEKGK